MIVAMIDPQDLEVRDEVTGLLRRARGVLSAVHTGHEEMVPEDLSAAIWAAEEMVTQAIGLLSE